MIHIDLNDFSTEKACIYDGERYSVRSNGTVMRHPREGRRPRPTDNNWTFGKVNARTGYLEIASVRVHRIVATAFHGEPPTSKHVVDHIDTNRQNNRPENLRWLTRLENALNNPIIRKRIALVCGSIEAFLDDPSCLPQSSLGQNFTWMRTVNHEEAQICKKRLHLWAESDKKPSGGSLDESIFQLPASAPAINKEETVPYENPTLVMSKTKGAAQLNWRVPADFPLCPEDPTESPMPAYEKRLEIKSVFAKNEFSQSKVIKKAISSDGQKIWVLCSLDSDSAIKPWALAEVTYLDNLYIHKSLGTFFTEKGAEKQFCLAQGLEWTGEDSIDDHC